MATMGSAVERRGTAGAGGGRSRARALLALLLLVPVPMVGVLAAMYVPATKGTGLGQGIYAASKVWILVLPLAWRVWIERERLSVSPVRKGGLGVGLLTGVGLAAAIAGGYLLLGRAWVDVERVQGVAAENGLTSPGFYLGLAMYLTLINSALEEYVWRWFVFRRCEIVFGGRAAWAAVALAGLFFTVHHTFSLAAMFDWRVTLLGSAGVFAGGAVWSGLYLKYRSVWPGWVSHVLADVAVFWAGYELIFGGA